MCLDDKVVIVTGAGAGIGAAIAIKFVKQGANVAIVGRRENKLNITAEKCSSGAANKILIIVADVTKENDAKRIVETTVEKFGKLDILVNNAGISKKGCISDGGLLSAYDDVMDVNVRAVIRLTTLAMPHLQKTKGNIVNISSAAAVTTTLGPRFFAYSISKAALDQFMRCAAIELATQGIRVNSVNPGPVKTDFLDNSDIPCKWEDLKSRTALNKVSEPEEIADLVVFLASNKGRSITGSYYTIDNGFLVKSS